MSIIIKSSLLLSTLLCTSLCLFSANHFSESFENLSSGTYGSGYSSGSPVFPSGTWDFTSVLWPENTTSAIYHGSKAVRMDDDVANCSITTPSVNSAGKLSFYFSTPQSDGGSSANIQIQKSINGGIWQNIASFTAIDGVHEAPTYFEATINDASNNIRLRILNDNTPVRVSIDFITLTSYLTPPIVNPEPSNYPTEFSASTISNSQINLTWKKDSIGPNHAIGYVIIASTGDTFLPSDGIELTDDQNLDDGYGIKLIPDTSIQSFTWTQMPPRTQFNFAIFPYQNTGTLIDYKTNGIYPKTYAKTFGLTNVIFQESFEGPDFMFDGLSISSNKNWQISSVLEYSEINGTLQDEPSDDWLISTKINFSGLKNPKMTFRTLWEGGSNNATNFLKLKWSSDYPGFPENPNLYTWHELPFEVINSSDWYQTSEIDLSVLVSKNATIAFHYYSLNSPRFWRLDDIEIFEPSYSFPQTWDLRKGSFSFDEWSANNSAGTYPNYMIFRQSQVQDPSLSIEDNQEWTCRYDLTSDSRIIGLGSKGISFVNSSEKQSLGNCVEAGYVGSLVLALNTTNRKDIEIQWTGGFEAFPNINNDSTDRDYNIRLQYRVGQSGVFQDVLNDAGYPVEYNFNGYLGSHQNMTASSMEDRLICKLPLIADNKPYIELRWKYYSVSGNYGLRPQLRVDDILVKSKSISTIFPDPFYLSHGDYIFNNWSSSNIGGTYPDHMRFYNLGSSDPTLSNQISTPYTSAYLPPTSNVGGIAALNNLGVAFRNNSTLQLGAAVLALCTENVTNIKVDWTAQYLHLAGSTDREYRIRLQYRIGNSGDFSDVLDAHGNPIEYIYNGYINVLGGDRTIIPLPQNFSNQLPDYLEDLPYVELMWKYYQHLNHSSGGNRPQIRLDDIKVYGNSTIGDPYKITIRKIEPARPMRGIPFKLTIDAVDYNDIAKNVKKNTDLFADISQGDPHRLFGSKKGILVNGNFRYVFTNLLYTSKADNLKIKVQTESLGFSEIDLDVIEGPNNLALVGFNDKAHCGEYFGAKIMAPALAIEARLLGQKIAYGPYHNYDIAISVHTGPAQIQGTTIKKSVEGKAVFDQFWFVLPGVYILKISAPGLPDIFTNPITVLPAPLVNGVKVPQIMKSRAPLESHSIIPTYALVEISGLHPNSVYKFVTGAVSVDGFSLLPMDDWGRGNNIHYYDQDNSYYYSISKDINSSLDSNCSTIQANNLGTKKVWVNLVPNNDPNTFKIDIDNKWIFNLADRDGNLVKRSRLSQKTKSKEFTTSSNGITGLYDYGGSDIVPRNFLLFYTNIDGVGDPISTAIVQDDAALLVEPGKSYNQGPPYYEATDNTNSAWTSVIPNNLDSGILRIEERDKAGDLVKAWINSTGIWKSTNTSFAIAGYTGRELEIPYLRIVSPSDSGVSGICNNNEYDIKWESHGIDFIDIELSQDGGITWTTIFSNVDASMGVIPWIVPRYEFSNRQLKMRLVNRTIFMIDVQSSVWHEIQSVSNSFTIHDYSRIESQSDNLIKCLGDDIEIFVSATGSNLSYQWLKDGVPISDIPNVVTGSNTAILKFQGSQYDISGIYECQINSESLCPPLISKPILIYIAGNTIITRQPSTIYSQIAQYAIFEIEAHVNDAPIEYDQISVQWYNGVNKLINNDRIAGANSSILIIKDIRTSDFSDDYFAIVTGLCGSARTNNISLKEVDIQITEHPDSLESCENGTVVFNVNAVALGENSAITYQWQKDGSLLSDDERVYGATSKSLTINNINETDFGLYYCIASIIKPIKSVRTKSALLEIRKKPMIISQPLSLTVFEGESFDLNFEVVSNLPLSSILWYKDNEVVSDNINFQVQKAESFHEGEYYAEVANKCGIIQTNKVIVNVVKEGTTYINNIDTSSFYLSLPNPNPSATSSMIEYNAPIGSYLELTLSDSKGNLIATIESNYSDGIKKLTRIDFEKLSIGTGVYFIKLKANYSSKFVKLIILK